MHGTVIVPGMLPAGTALVHTIKSLLLPAVTTSEPLVIAHLTSTVALPLQLSKPGVPDTVHVALPLM